MEGKFIPLPKPSNYSLLRVVVVNSPRFPPLSGEQVQRISALAVATAKNQLQIDVHFEAPAFLSLQELDAKLSSSQKLWVRGQSLDIDNDNDRSLLKQGIQADVLKGGGTLQIVQAYARAYLLKPPPDNSLTSFSEALADTQVNLMNRWKSHLASDGKPLLTSEGHSDYFLADARLHQPKI